MIKHEHGFRGWKTDAKSDESDCEVCFLTVGIWKDLA